jgi:hypothetical protein
MSRRPTNPARSTSSDHLVWRVMEYLDANRDEVLTRSDVAAKFDIAPSAVDSLLAPAVASGMLRREQSDTDGVVWCRRKRRIAFPLPFTPRLAVSARAVRRAKATARRAELESIVIESGIPIVERVPAKSPWFVLFDRMKVGQSFQLPTESSGALGHAKQKYCKVMPTARFVTRQVSDTHTRIWRTA